MRFANCSEFLQQLIKKKDKGGIAISHTVPLTQLEEPEIKAVLAEYKLSNCDVSFRCDAAIEEVSRASHGIKVTKPE